MMTVPDIFNSWEISFQVSAGKLHQTRHYKLHFMARKKNNNQEAEAFEIVSEPMSESGDNPVAVEPQEPPVKQEVASAPELPVSQSAHPQPIPASSGPTVQKAPQVTVPPKKRIRIRPSQKKKLSVAVLCTNPLTRRFI
jgi:PIN domain nuclease of toxin-antitoxin system